MERLWSPWRSQFIETHDDRPSDFSPFVAAWNEPEKDVENFLLHRGSLAFIILNRYPYNPGHLLVVPVRQVGDLLELTGEERSEMMDLVALGVRVLGRGIASHGCNVGMNLGRSAGAAIESHIHIHIVPRWNGDTNFMPTLNETRVVSQNMTDVFERLSAALAEVLGEKGDPKD